MMGIGASPIPQGNYAPATRTEQLAISAGMTPRSNGKLIFAGKVKAEEPLENYREAVVLAVKNALTAVQNTVLPDERIASVLSMTVYINAAEGFTAHSKLADFASDYLYKTLGRTAVAARTAVGVGSLPANAPVEIQIVCSIDREPETK